MLLLVFVMVRNRLRDEKVVWNGLRVEFEVADLERRERWRGPIGRLWCGYLLLGRDIGGIMPLGPGSPYDL